MITKISQVKYLFVAFIALVSIQLWSFKTIPDNVYNSLTLFCILLTALLVINSWMKKGRQKSALFSSTIWMFILLPLVSAFGALYYHGQGYFDSVLALKMNFLWLFYFLLHIFNIPTKQVIKLMVFMGVVWAVLTVVQQFTYPTFLFYTRDENTDGTSILRAGVYRFFVYRHHYGLLVVLYYLNEFLEKRVYKYLVYMFIGLAGFYFFGTRQFLAVTIVCMAVMILMQGRDKRAFAVFFLLLFIGIGYYFSQELFGKFITITSDELNDDNVRYLSYGFYFGEYWPRNDWFAKIIGNGAYYTSTKGYGAEVGYYEKSLGLYRADIGIVGSLNAYGILYVINLIVFNIKGLKSKYYTESSKYLKMFFLSSILLLPLTVYYDNATAIPFYCFICYLVDKAYAEKIEQASMYS